MSASIEEIASQTLDVVPLVMRTIRAKFREQRAADLSIAQFRTLAYIDLRDGVSLSEVAGHIGLTLPSMSKMVDGLVSRKLVSREAHDDDRRRVCLSLTSSGKKILQASYTHTLAFLAEKMSGLSTAERDTIQQAWNLMNQLFAVDQNMHVALPSGNE